MKYILMMAVLFAASVAAQEPVSVLFDNGSEVEVPEDHKVVFVRDDAPIACVEIEFLELIMPTSECSGLTVSPGCDGSR